MKATCALAAAFVGVASAADWPQYVYGPGPLYVYPNTNDAATNNLQVFSNGEKIYLGDYKALNDPEFAPVIYTLNVTEGANHIYLNPNTTALTQKPTWSNRILAEHIDIGVKGQDIAALDPNGDLSSYNTDWIAYATALFPIDQNGLVRGGWEWATKSSEYEGVWDVFVYWYSGALPDDEKSFVFRNKFIGN